MTSPPATSIGGQQYRQDTSRPLSRQRSRPYPGEADRGPELTDGIRRRRRSAADHLDYLHGVEIERTMTQGSRPTPCEGFLALGSTTAR
jgi:hypothetical protein